MIQIVDLASKASAVQLRDVAGGEVLDQFDSRNQSPFEFAARIARVARRPDCELTLIEDLPYGITSQAQTKPVTRFQGVIMAYCHPVIENVLWVNPSTWMASFPGVQRAPKGLTKSQADKARIEAARVHAERLGYHPPDLVAEYAASLPEGEKVLVKHTAPLAKTMTDYVSAFLIGEWALPLYRDGGREALITTSGVQPSMI